MMTRITAATTSISQIRLGVVISARTSATNIINGAYNISITEYITAF